jgi:FtsZ-interacting cell division protein ZipA
MSTGLIVTIVIVALILVGLLVLLPRMRAKAQERKAAKELESRRGRVATEHREEADTRSTRAEEAERQAAIAQAAAQSERAEAERHEQEAHLHERGLADERLIDDQERDRFDGLTGPARGADGDHPVPPRADTSFEQGREDEREAHGQR